MHEINLYIVQSPNGVFFFPSHFQLAFHVMPKVKRKADKIRFLDEKIDRRRKELHPNVVIENAADAILRNNRNIIRFHSRVNLSNFSIPFHAKEFTFHSLRKSPENGQGFNKMLLHLKEFLLQIILAAMAISHDLLNMSQSFFSEQLRIS